MKRLVLMAAPLLWLASPALAADLGPYPEERETYERPPIVDRKIVEHHHYYHQAPTVYREKRVYVEPRIYDEPIYSERLYPRRFAYAYQDWRPRHYFPRRHYWAHRKGHRNWN
jgi:hypothetical protein